ncbi:MAG: hypothetical protein HRT40_12485 [Campylobacteraceae bacterium]|nr:hypothetical protein [Campylobacteraceae bacterium]
MRYNNQNQIITKLTSEDNEFSFTYDVHANVLSDGEKTYTYTAFNKILTI